MTSVADIPHGDDEDDGLSGISPELVLVDPELARRVREREALHAEAAAPRPKRAPGLRLVAAPESEPPIVPRPAPTGLPAVERTVPVGEPARTAEPPRRPVPPPLAEPRRRSTTRVPGPEPPSAQATAGRPDAAMPHPVARPRASASARVTSTSSSSKTHGVRRVLGLLAGVAATSLAVLGVLQLTDRRSETPPTLGGPPALRTPPAPREATPKASAAAKPRATTKPEPRSKPAAKRTTKARAASAGATPTASAKARAASRPRARSTAPRTSSKPRVAPTQAPRASSPLPATRRFAWAPVGGAIGYHVELFKGARRVLAKDTKEPVLALARTWRYQGRTMTLSAGSYRWYVWPVTKTGRAPEAIVQATLTI